MLLVVGNAGRVRKIRNGYGLVPMDTPLNVNVGIVAVQVLAPVVIVKTAGAGFTTIDVAVAVEVLFKPAFSSVAREASDKLTLKFAPLNGSNRAILNKLMLFAQALELIPRTCMPASSDTTCMPPKPRFARVARETWPSSA